MKKTITLLLVLVMCVSLVACGGDSDKNPEIVKYVEDNRTELLSSMEESFATSSGMTCNSDIEVIGNGFVITIKINEMNDVPDEQKEMMQGLYDAMEPAFDQMLEEMKKELSAIEYFTIKVCEKDGDALATISAGK